MTNILMAVCGFCLSGAEGVNIDNNKNNTDNKDNKFNQLEHKDYSKDYYAGCSDFEPGISWKKEFSKLYLKFLIYFKGEDRAVKEFRKHLCWIFKSEAGISRAKHKFFKIKDYAGAISCINEIQ